MKITKKDRNFVLFWLLAGVFLVGWYFFWQLKNERNFASLERAVAILPMDELKKEEYRTIVRFMDYFLEKDGVEKTFLILFQNDMELRPGGGYIGSFGILKIKDGEVVAINTHDLSNFDGRIPDGIEPPYPMKETLRIDSWKMRDSNYSPDFLTNAQKAEEFYYLGQGEEAFAGIIAINSKVLTSFLQVTGPITLEGYPGTYGDEDSVLALEYQVEKGYVEQKIAKGDRKEVLNVLAQEIISRVFQLTISERLKLVRIILEDLNKKDIQLYFKDADLQAQAEKANWSGKVDQEWRGDYLMLVDANLGAYKSDYYIERSFEYSVDLSQTAPKAKLKITYRHTAKEKDWMTRDYLSYLRVYVPEETWLKSSGDLSGARFGKELGKKYFGFLVKVPLDSEKTVEYEYVVDEKILASEYDLLIQKQSGSGEVQGKVKIINRDGSQKEYAIDLSKDWKLSEN